MSTIHPDSPLAKPPHRRLDLMRLFRPRASTAAETPYNANSLFERTVARDPELARWMGWRLRMLVYAALLGCLAIFLLPQMLTGSPRIDATWGVDGDGQVRLRASAQRELQPVIGQIIKSIVANGEAIPIDALILERSARWIASDADRIRYHNVRQSLVQALKSPRVTLMFANGATISVAPHPASYTELGTLFWVFSGMGLLLYLLAMVVSLAKPSAGNWLYAVMALCQTGNLVCIAIESTVGLGSLNQLNAWDSPARMCFDLFTSAAAVHAVALHPRRLPGAAGLSALGWIVASLLALLSFSGHLQYGWWFTQCVCTALGLFAIALLTWSYRLEPHPLAIALRRLISVTTATWILLTLAVAVTDEAPGMQRTIESVGSTIWYVFLASLLALVPFLGKSQLVLREFSLLAAISTVATSLDLLFVAMFSLSQFASLTLSLFVSVGVYVGARQWLLSHLRGRNMITTERMFEQLYRTARAVEANPHQTASLLSQLLRDLFDPLQIILVDKSRGPSHVEDDGSTLRVSVPALSAHDERDAGAIVVRFAQRGRRLFTWDDARLTDRLVEQLRQAVAFDKAVEHGRSEERARLAQDLHDDIGARLLTLMYKATSPEMEDYVRHTLQDLKTLTRGLAAPSHKLSHAEGEWKSDLTQRLLAARISLEWRVHAEHDILLSVVQWSALTRILRELVSNIISHAQATRVDITLRFEFDRLSVTVQDNGIGQNPRAWAHGLGLGGVRKRAKQLGGEVEWQQQPAGGICCQVVIRQQWQEP
jgi:signal transduction histidine kinase